MAHETPAANFGTHAPRFWSNGRHVGGAEPPALRSARPERGWVRVLSERTHSRHTRVPTLCPQLYTDPRLSPGLWFTYTPLLRSTRPTDHPPRPCQTIRISHSLSVASRPCFCDIIKCLVLIPLLPASSDPPCLRTRNPLPLIVAITPVMSRLNTGVTQRTSLSYTTYTPVCRLYVWGIPCRGKWRMSSVWGYQTVDSDAPLNDRTRTPLRQTQRHKLLRFSGYRLYRAFVTPLVYVLDRTGVCDMPYSNEDLDEQIELLLLLFILPFLPSSFSSYLKLSLLRTHPAQPTPRTPTSTSATFARNTQAPSGSVKRNV